MRGGAPQRSTGTQASPAAKTSGSPSARSRSQWIYTLALSSYTTSYQQEKDNGIDKDCSKFAGDPINVGNGNSVQSAIDYDSFGSRLLRVERTYNSRSPQWGTVGSGWRHYYERSVTFVSGTPRSAIIRRPDGRTLQYLEDTDTTVDGFSAWLPADPDMNDQLKVTSSDGTGSAVPTSWRYITESNLVEDYDSYGRLVKLSEATGQSVSLSHDGVWFWVLQLESVY